MKRFIILIYTVIIMSQFLIGCSGSNDVELKATNSDKKNVNSYSSDSKDVEFKEFYSQVIGFSENDEQLKTIHQDAVLMMDNEGFQKFKDEYFTLRKIPMKSPDKEKAVLYLQIPSPTSLVNSYNVKSINVSNDTLTVNLNQSGAAEVNGIEGFNGTWKWVMFIEVDKTNLKENMEIVIGNDEKVTTIDDKNFTIDNFTNILKTKGYTLEVKDADEDFLSTTRKTISLGDEPIDVYIYNSNEEMEKDSLNIDSNGFVYTITDAEDTATLTNASWSSYPHFYKKGNIIVKYIGKNEEIIFNLKDIFGEQFAGIKECSDLSCTEKDIREIAFNQLDSETQKKIKSWQDSKITIETLDGKGMALDDESYLGKDAYCVEFILDVNYLPNNIFVYIGMDNHKIIGHGFVD